MLELKLEKIAKTLLYAIPFLVLLFIEGFYFPFMITRTVFFRLLIELALSVYFLLLALDWQKYKPRWNWALGLVMVLLLAQLVAAIFGLDFYKSFWSDFERMEGVVSAIYLLVYLFLLQIFFKEKGDWLFYIRLILISSCLVSLYGLAQKFNILPVFEAGIGRVTSTIGNAAFLAGYSLIAIGLSIYYYFNEADKNYGYFALANGLLNLLILLLTSTRGAILGLGLGALIFFLLNTVFLRSSTANSAVESQLPSKAKFRKFSAALLLIIILLGAGFFLLRGKFANSRVEFVRRLATISLADGTVLNRLLVWRMALADFKYHPWLGIGAENFEVIYNKYYTPAISENWFDRTHNVYLDQLMAGGVFGLAAYLAIWFYLLYSLFKKRRDDYWQFAVLSSLLLAYGVHNFFVFDTLNTSFLYFFLIGLASFKQRGLAVEAGVKLQPPNNDNRVFNYTFIALVIVNILVLYKLVYLPLKINRAIYVGYYYALADTFRSYENFKLALNYKFGSVEAAVQLNKMNEVVESQSNANAYVKSQYLALAQEKLRFASLSFPLDIKTKMYLAQLILNNYQDIKELDEAETLLLAAKKLSPLRVECHYLLYNLYARRGEKIKARAVLEDLVKQLPWYGGAKIMLMADVYKEDPKRAEELYQAAIKQDGYDSFDGLNKIINYLLGGKRYEETIPYYNRLIKNNPRRYDYRLDLAKVYYLINDFAAAREQVNIIGANSPGTLEDSEGLLKLLDEAGKKK